MHATITKTQNAQPMGTYTPTDIDRRKAEAPFRLLQVSPNLIAWKDGSREIVTGATLKKLQAQYPNWVTDF